MSLATGRDTSGPHISQKGASGRIWRTSTSSAWWFWLLLSLLLYAGIFAWYLIAIKTQPFPDPFNDPLRSFGILAFALVLGTASYSLRRRFIRGLPGKAQAWLWMHTWLGLTAVLIALLHENFTHITHDYCQNMTCFTNAYWGTSALFALIFLVVSGIAGRLLDTWQARIIARDASTNGVGIARAIEERMLELEYTIERLSAGKSEPFQQYCMQAIDVGTRFIASTNLDVGTRFIASTPRLDASTPRHNPPKQADLDVGTRFIASTHGKMATIDGTPTLDPREQADFERAYETLTARAHLAQSLERQKRARLIMRTWRTIHIVLACLALLIILYHGTMELLTQVLHVLPV